MITDVAGLSVGHSEDRRLLSGVTAILVEGDNVASGVTRGGAPGGRDTTLLEPGMTVERIDAVVLSGGSVFGLDAAGGVVGYLRSQGVGMAVGSARVPIATQAITFDLLNGGDKDWGRQCPYYDLGWQAAAAARSDPFALGSAGAGLGATTATFKGGVGSVAMTTASGFTVAALAVVNAVGSVTVGRSRHFWAAPYECGGEFGGHGWPARFEADDLATCIKGGAPPSTTIALVATDAQLTKTQAQRLAQMADDGLARAVRPAHAPMDGDTVFALATQRQALDEPLGHLTELGQAAADCLARAIAVAVFEAAVPEPNYIGPPAYRDVHGGGRAT